LEQRERPEIYDVTTNLSDKDEMSAENYKKFSDLKEIGGLLDPAVPGGVVANLALRGGPKELNGKYVRYNDKPLESYLQ
jgi:hypothetical protein